MNWLVLWFALQAGFMTNNQMVTYEPSVGLTNTPTEYTELSAELRLLDNHVFLGGTVKTEIQKAPVGVTFSPESSAYVFNLGLRYHGIEVGWMHLCAHPTLPYYKVLHPVVGFDQAYDDLYVRFHGTFNLLGNARR